MKKDLLSKNIFLFKLFTVLSNTVLIWSILVPYMKSKDLSFFYIMIFFSITKVFSIIFEIPTGILSDKLNHKFVIALGAFFKAITFLLLIFCNIDAFLIISAICFGLSDALLSGSTTALLYESLICLHKESNYKQIIQKTKSITMISVAFSTLLSGFIYNLNPYLPFIITCIFMFLSFFISLLFNTIPTTSNNMSHNFFRENLKKDIKSIKPLISIILVTGVFSLIYTNMNLISQEYMIEKKIEYQYFGIIFFISNIVSAIVFNYGHKLENLFKKHTICIMSIFIGICFIILRFNNNIMITLLAIPLMRVSSATVIPILDTLLNDSIKSANRATILSISNGLVGFFEFVFDPLLGKIIDYNGIFYTLEIFIIISFVLAFSIYIFNHKIFKNNSDLLDQSIS